jgi:hypothetical protein
MEVREYLHLTARKFLFLEYIGSHPSPSIVGRILVDASLEDLGFPLLLKLLGEIFRLLG